MCAETFGEYWVLCINLLTTLHLHEEYMKILIFIIMVMFVKQRNEWATTEYYVGGYPLAFEFPKYF